MFEDGGQRRDFVHVRDVAAATVAATTAPMQPGSARPYNIGSGRVSTVLEMAQALSAAYGGPEPVVTGQYRAADVRHVTASSERAAQELRWRPTVPLASGVRDLVEPAAQH